MANIAIITAIQENNNIKTQELIESEILLKIGDALDEQRKEAAKKLISKAPKSGAAAKEKAAKRQLFKTRVKALKGN